MIEAAGWFLDAETYYDNEVSLRRMTVQEYVAHPKFHVHGWAAQPARFTLDDKGVVTRFELDGDVAWYPRHEFLDSLQGGEVLVAHNASFDATVLHRETPRYRPRLWVDTMAMGRAILGPAQKSFALDALGKAFDVGGKAEGGAALVDVMGMTTDEIEADGSLSERFVEYALRDVELMVELFERMTPRFPRPEWWVVDWTVRMMAYPRLCVDLRAADILRRMAAERTRRLVEAAGVPKSTLSSDAQFARLLTNMGVDVPTKVSERTGKEIPAVASKDIDFLLLVERMREERPDVAAVCDARMAAKSTINETRAAKLATVAQTMPVDARRGGLRVPLRYAGAIQTKRFSGGDGLNLQNLPRGKVELDVGDRTLKLGLRDCIVAPKGYKLVVVDLSGIELRVLMTLAGQTDAMQRIFAGEDEYCVMASRIYGREISKKEHPEERQVGKVAVLSLGYQSGAATFQAMLLNMAGLHFDMDFCKRVVQTYRSTYRKVVGLWYALDDYLRAIARGDAPAVPPVLRRAPLVSWVRRPDMIGFQSRTTLGDGSFVTWPSLHETPAGELRFHNARYDKAGAKGWVNIYGGKAVENLCQFLAREVVNFHARVIWENTRLWPSLQVHDELVYVVKADKADALLDIAIKEMTGPVPWWPELVTAAEGDTAVVYGNAK